LRRSGSRRSLGHGSTPLAVSKSFPAVRDTATGADDRAGALGFGLNVEPPAPKRHVNRTLDLQTLQAEADAVITDEPWRGGSAAGQVRELLLEGTSMGGARPKTVVQDDHALWLVKFGRQDDRWNQPRVKHALLVLVTGLRNQCSR